MIIILIITFVHAVKRIANYVIAIPLPIFIIIFGRYYNFVQCVYVCMCAYKSFVWSPFLFIYILEINVCVCVCVNTYDWAKVIVSNDNVFKKLAIFFIVFCQRRIWYIVWGYYIKFKFTVLSVFKVIRVTVKQVRRAVSAAGLYYQLTTIDHFISVYCPCSTTMPEACGCC